MKDALILRALQGAAIQAVALCDDPTLPIKGVARNFVPPADARYLELVFIPNNRGGDFWGDEKNYRGLFRLVLHWPNDDAGAYPPLELLASVCSFFPKGKDLQGVQIYETPDLASGPIEAGHETLYSASLRYQSFRQ